MLVTSQLSTLSEKSLKTRRHGKEYSSFQKDLNYKKAEKRSEQKQQEATFCSRVKKLSILNLSQRSLSPTLSCWF